jgi:uncharacterized damage-inducible protein DinB
LVETPAGAQKIRHFSLSSAGSLHSPNRLNDEVEPEQRMESMTSTELLVDAFERIRDAVHPAVNGLSRDELAFRPEDNSNSIAWLVWHLTRIQDDHVAGLDGREQVWTANGWAERFALSLDLSDTGYGHGPEHVAMVTGDDLSLLGYFEDVHDKTLEFVRTLADEDLSRVVDRSWDPPVTMRVRLMSVIADDLQHAGQAAYVRGILQQR